MPHGRFLIEERSFHAWRASRKPRNPGPEAALNRLHSPPVRYFQRIAAAYGGDLTAARDADVQIVAKVRAYETNELRLVQCPRPKGVKGKPYWLAIDLLLNGKKFNGK